MIEGFKIPKVTFRIRTGDEVETDGGCAIGGEWHNATTDSYFKGKSLNDISKAQYRATKKVFEMKKIPFRDFYLKKRDEETLGELFTFFILETILLGMLINVNPYDQPAVELIKKETKKKLI